MFTFTPFTLIAALLMALAIPSFSQAGNGSIKKETTAMTAIAFPAIGHVFRADYGERVYRVAFDADGKTLRWAPFPAEDFDAAATTETYRALPIRPGVFMVTWKEADGTTVTHVEDFEHDTVHAAITLPDHTFLNLTGSWTRVD
ncbi:hypothetical protein BZL41_24960 [Pseudomonas sp. PIC25]|uniref:MoaF-related domain-containing protein n=1 Tax=Pseudomonas sp. PIC25 TaxID=1958773 RepID=UPI000BABBDD7|nr:hypothetical protein [Pseudomonas sp. PIC25]PAU52526.1 hypothetical protein BZL41_24960 [Pseudomonas sp. PIC25]